MLKKIVRVIGLSLGVVVLVIAGLATWVKVALPNVGKAADLHFDYTPQQVARGQYLAVHVCACIDCHSTRDWSKFSGPLTPGTLGMGGEVFDRKFGFPGIYYSRNITPAGIGRYTDGELFRVITTGVTKEGRAMFPVMPYPYYGKMDSSDIKCIIAFLRTLTPIQHDVPPSVSDFPMNIIINTIPRPATCQNKPDSTDKAAYGAYLVNAAGCIECHTPAKNGQIIPELAFTGGREFNMPGGTIVSRNITPDPEHGIGSWTEEAFINRFKSYADSGYQAPPVAPGTATTVMPWTMYGGMTKSDLSAIYLYLHNLPQKSAAQ